MSETSENSENTFLVTGAHGFIGAWIVKRLLARGARVVALDQSTSRHRWQLIMDESEIEQARFIAGDITDGEFVRGLVEENGVTRIIHLAGLQVPTCRANPRMGALVNVIGTINIFEAARLSGGRVDRVAYASSAAVFGSAERSILSFGSECVCCVFSMVFLLSVPAGGQKIPASDLQHPPLPRPDAG